MISRRDLIREAGALASLPLMTGPAMAALSRLQPDVILHNGHVITIDPRNPTAEAIAIAGDRVLAVGTNDEIAGLASSGTKKS